MADLSFPTSSTPGARFGEGQGRLVNTYAVKDGDSLVYAPSPGLIPFATVGAGPRGGLLVGSSLYWAATGQLFAVEAGGAASPVDTLAGSGPVSMARNNKLPTPDVVIVTDDGAFTTDGSAVASYPDADVGSPNSVSFLDAYFVFTYGDGTIRASELNSEDIDAESYTKAEAKPDGILRGIVVGRQFIALGSSSAEFYSNVGTQPFPLARDEVVNVGLFGRWAVAGFEDGWDGPWISVASDRTVRLWQGYTPTVISTRDVQRAIAGVVDPETLVAFVYAEGGESVFVLSGPGFTWEYHVGSGTWVERESLGLPMWRARFSVRGFGRWLVGDTLSPSLMQVRDGTRREADAPLVCEAWGLGPANSRLGDLRLYFSTGQGHAAAEAVPEREPVVLVDWSMNGGASFGSALQRSLGRQGEFRRRIGVSSLGTSRDQPLVMRWRVSDPVMFQFVGGTLGRVSAVR